MFAKNQFPYTDQEDFNMNYKIEPSKHNLVNLFQADPLKKKFKSSNNHEREK